MAAVCISASTLTKAWTSSMEGTMTLSLACSPSSCLRWRPVTSSHMWYWMEILIQRGVPLVQCPAEADWEIACLARQWNCPVLTNDSDFYIFDLPGGYLPLSYFQWTNVNGKASHHYILARCYTTDELCRSFGSINKELLPLCAVLAGNDYGTPKDADKIIDLIGVSGIGRGGGRGRAPISRIEGFLLWLSCFKFPADVLEEVRILMGEEGGGVGGKRGQKGGLSSQLREGMQEYHITTPSALAYWFSEGKAAPRGQTSWLPECLSRAAAQGLLAPLVVDALVMHRVLLFPQVENSRLASSHCSASAIRQAIYRILLQRGQDFPAQDMRAQENISQGMRGGRGRRGRGGGGVGQVIILPTQQTGNSGFSIEQAGGAATVSAQGYSAPMCVEEYDRMDLNLKKNNVEAHPLRTHLLLGTMDQAPVEVRLGVMLEVLGSKESALAPVPLHLRLAVAVTAFWFREAKPPPSQPQLKALLLGMVYGELSWTTQPGATHYQHTDWAAEHNVRAGLDCQRVKPRERRGLDVGGAHSFSQWQACLWSALCLNQLLLRPLPEPHLSLLYSGTLVHGLLKYLKGGRAAESLLVGGSMSGPLYSFLLDTVRNCSSKTHPSSSAAWRGKRGGSRGRRGRGRGVGERGRGGRGRRGTEEINNRFALLMSEEESDY
ncbi:protein asteroid homolog 1 isoform X2 [Cyclopterus lumpus]|uniref:protein asteroid homolog 1 isoform X2 n=1 Tax=Cyclopterus lumpus TaxID=8103 RepID=UPI00148715AC|nr:protein asteroid homolog 1 isoform X2 [Cyclopterus lumpus]